MSIDWIWLVILSFIILAVVLTFFRLLRGPTLPDRVVALDLMSALGVGFIAVYAIATDESTFLDVAIVVALISFLGTIAFAYYVQRGV